MTIDEQLELFYLRLREAATNSRILPTTALDYLNHSRRSIAIETRFYNVHDSVTAVGGETYWTLLDSFLGPIKARDWATCNGRPVVMKSKAEWATITDGIIIPVLASQEVWGILDGKQFYRYPAAQPGDVHRWRGYGLPEPLPAVSGGDAYTDDVEAELIVLDAVQDALEDLNREPGTRLKAKYNSLKKLIKDRAKPIGPRLETAQDDVWPL
jgi:hypothetical protein